MLTSMVISPLTPAEMRSHEMRRSLRPGVGARQHQHVVDDASQPRRLLLDHPQRLAIFLRVPLTSQTPEKKAGARNRSRIEYIGKCAMARGSSCGLLRWSRELKNAFIRFNIAPDRTARDSTERGSIALRQPTVRVQCSSTDGRGDAVPRHGPLRTPGVAQQD